MEEIVEKVSAAPYVTVMDLSKGYFQIPLTPRAQRYAAFVTPFGTYIPKKMMFGLHNSSPLTDALKGKIKKEKITWDEKCGKAFEELKAMLVSQPILFAPDFATDFILQMDATSGLWCQLDKTNNCLTILLWTRSLPGQWTVALHTQWRIVLKGGKTTTVGRRGSAVGACVRHLLVCEETGLEKRVEKKEKEGEREKEEKESSKRRGLVVLGNGEENPRVLFRDADQESKTRMRNNALQTGPRQAVE
ncbi:retrovirus-related Pol polyprotein from transposon 297 [Trichonephila clavipes]|nr:retrovirus-related Pol polyprotein from transposon 297 [Trichonephila clavipes]